MWLKVSILSGIFQVILIPYLAPVMALQSHPWIVTLQYYDFLCMIPISLEALQQMHTKIHFLIFSIFL